MHFPLSSLQHTNNWCCSFKWGRGISQRLLSPDEAAATHKSPSRKPSNHRASSPFNLNKYGWTGWLFTYMFAESEATARDTCVNKLCVNKEANMLLLAHLMAGLRSNVWAWSRGKLVFTLGLERFILILFCTLTPLLFKCENIAVMMITQQYWLQMDNIKHRQMHLNGDIFLL